AGDLYVFRGRSGNLIKIIWHDGLGMSLYAKRLEKGRFLWPSPADGTVPYHRRSSPTCSTGSIGATRVTRSALSSRAEFFFEFAPFSASQRTRFMVHSRTWLPPPRMLFRTILAR
ncbi:IS66 family insertion sequence element accessory protein TnpB, partial [Mesorhizobium sp. M0684]|uniref:IS66 family insertion sequence element accessory protein TnpB n=1 Tax=Mesorhizobium sp. M0684 TaxID=2956986 RepID=UPI00333BE51C